MAMIYQHPRSPVKFEPPPPDPREQAVVDPYPPVTDEEWAQLEAVEVLRIIGQKYGYDRVGAWVKNLGFIAGQDA